VEKTRGGGLPSPTVVSNHETAFQSLNRFAVEELAQERLSSFRGRDLGHTAVRKPFYEGPSSPAGRE
jgi:hypothetical protein